MKFVQEKENMKIARSSFKDIEKAKVKVDLTDIGLSSIDEMKELKGSSARRTGDRTCSLCSGEKLLEMCWRT